MRVSYLELRNYRRFKELKLQFPDGVIGILGLNGSGKSTIIEGLAWALFGNVDEVVRTSRESVRRAGASPGDTCSAILEFELGGVEYRIEREMGGKSLTMKASIRTENKILAEGDKTVKKMVEKLIGMDHKSFFVSVFARQKELNALQTVAAGERRKVVLRLLRIDGVDSILQSVRDDRRAIGERIAGAQSTLLDEQGRDREPSLRESLKELARAQGEASEQLLEAEKRERQAVDAVELVKKKRDELRKDVDAYNSTSKDLAAKKVAISSLVDREKRLDKRSEEATRLLEKLPALVVAEKSWSDIARKKEELDTEKSRSEKAQAISKDIESLLGEETELIKKLKIKKAAAGDPVQTAAQIRDVDNHRSECEAERSRISIRIGELQAQRLEKVDSSAKDRKKLDEIGKAGKEGVCPTCERTLEDRYELLIKKLRDGLSEAEVAVSNIDSEMGKLKLELSGTNNKAEALKRKRAALDQTLERLQRADAEIKSGEGELARLRDRLIKKREELAKIGEPKYSEEEHRKVKADYERLRVQHDEYIRIKGTQEELKRLTEEKREIRSSADRHALEEEGLKSLIKVLEPKKDLYEVAIKDLDQKTSNMNSVKDDVRKLSIQRDRAKGELTNTGKELERIERTKKNIEGDIKGSENLALLEDVLVSFRDHLIGRVVPTLSEITSKMIGTMTDGRYGRVELREDYEIQIDDQGTLYPVDRFSGGESDLANLGLRLAISRIIAERTGATPMNFLILDEIFGSQDPTRKRSLMTALAGLSSQFRQVFLITHIEDIKDLMNYVIRVDAQEDGTSTAELVG